MISEVVYHHGSPGHPSEGVIFEALPFKYRAIDRLRQRNGVHHKDDQPLSPDTALIGYSWGARKALETALGSPHNIKALVLIAPYLSPKPTGLATRFLLALPGLGDLLLQTKAKTIVGELLQKTSAPKSVPSTYLEYGKLISTKDRLRSAVLEKAPFDLGLASRLRQLKIPVLVVFGEGDHTSTYETQVSPLLEALPYAKLVRVVDGGHALPFTHPEFVLKTVQTFLEDL
jgi:pimeloyl-ACP methyl ester carboxylesterase